MSGMNAVTKLKSQGIDAKQDMQPKVDVFDIFIPREGILQHPRADDPIDEELLSNPQGTGIMDVGQVEESICVRRDGMYEGKMRLTLIYGSRRTLHLIEAVRRWKEAGTFREEQKYIRTTFFVGDDKAALLHRQAEDSRPLKKAHSPRVLAFSAKQMTAAKCTPEEILAVMPRSVKTKADLEALLRWGDLTEEAAKRFDEGAPIGLLGKVLDAPREKQAETLDRFVAAGIDTANKATRLEKRERKPQNADPTNNGITLYEGHPSAGKKAKPKLTPAQIRALAVGANKLGMDHDVLGKFLDENGDVEIDPIVAMSQADGFALFGKLVTQEIGIDDLPVHLRDMAHEVLNKK